MADPRPERLLKHTLAYRNRIENNEMLYRCLRCLPIQWNH